MNEYENIGPSLPCRIGLIVASVNITRHQPQNATLRADCQQINLSAYIMFLYASDLSQFTSVICISLYIYILYTSIHYVSSFSQFNDQLSMPHISPSPSLAIHNYLSKSPHTPRPPGGLGVLFGFVKGSQGEAA